MGPRLSLQMEKLQGSLRTRLGQEQLQPLMEDQELHCTLYLPPHWLMDLHHPKQLLEQIQEQASPELVKLAQAQAWGLLPFRATRKPPFFSPAFKAVPVSALLVPNSAKPTWWSWLEANWESQPRRHLLLVGEMGWALSLRLHRECCPPPSPPPPERHSPWSQWLRLPPSHCWCLRLPLPGGLGTAQFPTRALPLPPAPRVGATPQYCHGPLWMRWLLGCWHHWEKSSNVPLMLPQLRLLHLKEKT